MAIVALVLATVLVGLVIGVLPSTFDGSGGGTAVADASYDPTVAPLTLGALSGCLKAGGFHVARSGEQRLIASRSGFRPTHLVVYDGAKAAHAAAKGRWVAINNVAVRYGRTGDTARNTPETQRAFTGCLAAE